MLQLRCRSTCYANATLRCYNSGRSVTHRVNYALRKTGRPLKVLIPMIQSELQQGNAAGQEHYRRAGQMLIEAKDQVGYGNWGRWLAKNFDLNDSTARVYMRWARAWAHRHDNSQIGTGGPEVPYASLRKRAGFVPT